MNERPSEVDRLLTCAFGVVPPLVRELVSAPSLDALEGFAASLVIPFADRPVRIAASDAVDPAGWERTVIHRFPLPVVAEFLSVGERSLRGRRPRRMIDTAGGTTAELYLDDLDVDESGKLSPTEDVMAATLHVPSQVRTVLLRRRDPPHDDVPVQARPALESLVTLGAKGVWALRTIEDQAVGFVWVSESRWRKDAAATLAIAQGLKPPEPWTRVTRLVAELGYTPYPDAIEWTPEGLDVTLGIVRDDAAEG